MREEQYRKPIETKGNEKTEQRLGRTLIVVEIRKEVNTETFIKYRTNLKEYTNTMRRNYNEHK